MCHLFWPVGVIGSARNPFSYTPSAFRASSVCGDVCIDYYSISYIRHIFRSDTVVMVALPLLLLRLLLLVAVQLLLLL